MIRWEQRFVDKSTAVAFDGLAEIGRVQRIGGSWLVQYKGDDVAFRPDKKSAMEALVSVHAEAQKERQ